MKRRAWGLAGLVFVAGLAVSLKPRSAPPPRPSLLLVTIDTLRADRVGAYGSTAGLTPAIDGLALRGWRFEQATSAVPLTLPAHASILSGLEPLHHGVHNNGTYTYPEDRETLASRLKASGYATAAFVGATVLDHRFGLNRGFDVYDDRIERASGGRSTLESERPCPVVSGHALDWMLAQAGPFFAWVHFYEPHAPYSPPLDLAAAHPQAPYDAEVAAADRCLSTLLAGLEGAGRGNVVVAVTGDHGEALGEHGETTHGLFVYQSTLRVPEVIAGPGVPVGKRTPGLVRSVDLAPTLLGILGVPALSGIDGRNLVTERPSGEAYAESEYAEAFGWAPLRSWRLGDLKLIDAPRPELYDLARDPGEREDVASSRPADVDRLRGILGRARSSERRSEARSLRSADEEALRSLGYVAGQAGGPGVLIGMDPKDAAPWLRNFESARMEEARGNWAASARVLEDLSSRDPANITFLRSWANALSKAGRPLEAARILSQRAGKEPHNARVLHDLALAMSATGRAKEAMEAEKKALAIEPGLVDALNHLATLQAQEGEWTQARRLVDQALALDSNDAQAWSNRGNIARAQNDPSEAERSFRRALDLAPNLVDALNGLGVMAVGRGALDEAASLFERALDRDPGFFESRLNLAVVEAQRGHEREAITLARSVAQSKDPLLREKARSLLRDLKAPGP